jgi:hypothetical protein
MSNLGKAAPLTGIVLHLLHHLLLVPNCLPAASFPNQGMALTYQNHSNGI